MKLEWDLEPFTLPVIGANMDNHSFFERNVLWECLPDDWCPGVPVGGRSPRGLKADFHVTEGPSERDIHTMEIRAVSSADGDQFIDWVAGIWYENANHRRGGFIWWDTDDAMLRGDGHLRRQRQPGTDPPPRLEGFEILEDQRRNFVGLPLPGSTSGIQYSVLGDWAQDTALGEFRANVAFRYVPQRWGHFTKENPNAS